MSREELRGRQEEAGGRTGEHHGREGVLEFGDVAGEYRRLREAAAAVDDADRALLEVRGEAALEHFGGLVTHHLEGTVPGEGVYAFMLTAQGRPVTDLRALCLEPDAGEERILVDLPGACREAASDHLARYLPPRLASRRERDDLVRLGLDGPAARRALAAATDGDVSPPDEPLAHRRLPLADLPEPVRALRREAIEGGGVDLYVPAGRAAAAWEALAAAARRSDGGAAGLVAREAVRVERGVPAGGREITEEVLPQETGQEGRAISYEKGCYTGQEVVAKIHYRGRVNRHLRGLRLDEESGLPAAGTELHDADRSRGRVTTAVRSPRLGPIALAYLHRSVEPGQRVAVGAGDDAGAEVVELPFEA